MKQKRITVIAERPSVRAETIDGNNYFVGYAAVYNQRSRLIFERDRLFYEIIRPGAFDKILAEPALDVPLTLDHEHFYSLGRTVSGNLKLETDETGLKFRALVPNTQIGRDTFEMITRGDYTDCSFMFMVNENGEEWIRENDGTLVHIIKEISALFDITICTLRGAYEQTVIDVERASRMFAELEKPGREEIPGGEGSQGNETGSGDTGDNSNDNQADKDRTEAGVENELDKMIIDVHKAKAGSGAEN